MIGGANNKAESPHSLNGVSGMILLLQREENNTQNKVVSGGIVHNIRIKLSQAEQLSKITGIALGVMILLLISPVCAEMNTSFTCGVILPLTGDYGALGVEVKQGIECAASEINASGGSDGQIVHLEIADDMSDPDRASSLFADMKSRGIPVVIGSLTTALTMPMAQQTISDNHVSTILISPQANGDDLYGISPGFYQVLSPVLYLGKIVTDWLSYTAERIALVHVDDSYGSSFSDAVKKELQNTTSPVISTDIPIPHDDPGFSRTTSQILDNVSDTVVITGCDDAVIPLINALGEAGFSGQIVLTDSCLFDALTTEKNNVSLDKFSLVTANVYTSLVPGRDSEQFVANYQERYGKSPDGSYAGYGYDTLMIIHEALIHTNQSEQLSVTSLMHGLEKIHYYGVTGPKIFDPKNAVTPTYDRYIYRNGNFEILSTSIR